MGQPPRCTRTPSLSKSDFDQAERVAFQHVREQLAHMAGCGLEDLEQAAFSYLVQSLNASGIQVREQWARGKATTWATWWHTRHSAARQTRPHSQYSPAQALRGRQVAAVRKRSRTDWMGLHVQLMRWQGRKVAQIAGRLDCSERSVFRLSKRRFPRLVLVILGQALNLTHGKSSCAATSQIQTIGPKEQLPRVRVEAARRPAGAQIDGAIGKVEQIGAAIPDLLRAHWASSGT